MDADRRRHSRVPPAVGYELSCRPAVSTRLIDASPGGVCLATPERLPLGLRLVLEIRLPGEPGRFRAQAVVAWSADRAAGLRFDHVDEDVDLPEPAPEKPAEPRRRHKRYFPGRGDIVFAPGTLWTAIGFRPKDVAVRIVNLSAGGAHLVCAGRVEPGTRGTMSFDFSRPRVTIEGDAQVVWCKRDTLLLTPEWHVGLAFRRVADPESLRSMERAFLG